MKKWTRYLGGMLIRIALPLIVAIASAAFFYYQRHWVWELSVWTGLALGLLMYAVMERVKVLSRLYRKSDPTTDRSDPS